MVFLFVQSTGKMYQADIFGHFLMFLSFLCTVVYPHSHLYLQLEIRQVKRVDVVKKWKNYML